jgi:hypothetical protein
MTIRSRDKQVLLIVRKLIHDWDPYRLLEIGAPEDEWDREILRIAGCVNRICNPADAAEVISEIFTEAFQPKGFGQADCAEIGTKLFTALNDAGLIPAEKR